MNDGWHAGGSQRGARGRRHRACRPCLLRASTTAAIGVLVCLLLGLPAAAADDEEARFVEGLRQRRLFSLAETFCQARLADPQLGQADRAELVSQLLRCYAAQAAHAVPAEREPLWQRARQTAADFQREQADNPRAILVRVQDALTALTQGELLRLEAELLPAPGTGLEDARGVLREAGRLLEQLDEDLARQIPQRHRQPPRADDELSAAELTALQQHVRYQRSRALRGLALCYAADSDDRIAMLTQAVQTLGQGLTQLAAGDPLADRFRIEQAGGYRLLGDFAAAEQALNQVQPAADQPDTLLESRAEAARLALAQRQPQQAWEVLSQGRQSGGRVSAELDFAHLETYLALWRDAHDRGDAERAEGWQAKAVAMVRWIEQLHGPAWGRRADLLLVQTFGGSPAAAGLDVLIRTGDDLYRKGQADEAIVAYEKAAAAAAASGQTAQAFQLRYRAALVDQNRQRYQAAARRLRALARELPAQPQAAETHLLAAWNAAQAARHDEAALDDYAAILTEHLTLWTASETCETVRLWLGRLRERQQQWAAAADAYRGIGRDSQHFAEALPAAIRCWEAQLQQQSADGAADPQARASAAQAIADALAERLQPLAADEAQAWTATDRLAAEAAARFLVRDVPRGGAQAESLLRAALRASPPPDAAAEQGDRHHDSSSLPASQAAASRGASPPFPPVSDAAWRVRAESLLVLALAAQDGKQSEAERALRQLGSLSPQQLAELVASLSQGASAAAASGQRELAAIRLAAIEMLGERLAQLEAADQARIERWRAESLAAIGRHAEAVTAYASLAARYPNDAALQTAYAELLLAGDDPQGWTVALEQWRRIGQRARPQTDLWYQAKYATAMALSQLGQKREAAERIQYLQATTPGLDDTPWAQKFSDLLQHCQQP